jgi:hypothetical protein
LVNSKHSGKHVRFHGPEQFEHVEYVLDPNGIHAAHAVIDGAIDTPWGTENFPARRALRNRDGMLNPGDIAEAQRWPHSQRCLTRAREPDGGPAAAVLVGPWQIVPRRLRPADGLH